MPVIIDNRPLFEEAERLKDSITTFYTSLNSGKLDKGAKKIIEGILKRTSYEAFNLPSEVRKQTSDLNDRLKTMLNKGYLELKEDEISMFDPVTEEYYWKQFSKEFSKNA